MKIAVLTPRFDFTSGGGAERSAFQVCQELAARGHEVQVITGWCPPGTIVTQMQVIPWRRHKKPRSGVDVIRFSNWAVRQMAGSQYDTTLSFSTTVPAAVIQPRAGMLRENIDRTVALRRHSVARVFKRLNVLLSPRQQALLYLERRTIVHPMVKRFIAISRYVAEQFKQHYHVDPSRITLIRNGAMMPELSPSRRRALRERVRDQWNIPKDETVYLFAAFNPRLKGIEPLLHAARRIKQQGVPFVLMLAGQFENAQRRLAVKFGLRDHLRQVGTTNEMASLYCAADVTVMPSYYDAASKVVIESLIMGVPAISSAYNGASDWLQADDGRRRGRLVREPNDVAALAMAMVELADPQERARCAEATMGIERELSMGRHVDELEQVLSQRGH